MAMNRAEFLSFLRRHRLCVVATVSAEGAPQAAVVGYAVSEQLEIVFDTLASTRKVQNLRRAKRMAVVVGWDEEQTLQIEGEADEPGSDERLRLQTVYLQTFPDGVTRQQWPGITYVRLRPRWARYSDFRPGGTVIELDGAVLTPHVRA